MTVSTGRPCCRLYLPILANLALLYICLNVGAAKLYSQELVEIVDGLSSPLFLTHAADGTGRLFIVEQEGLVRIVAGGTLLATPFLDIRSRVCFGGERGLLGLAFHPGYALNGRFFVYYFSDQDCGGSGATILAEYHVSFSDPDQASLDETTLLPPIEQAFSNHNGGMLAFGPDGFLYVGVGDGGSGGDPLEHGQNINTLQGSLLRLSVDDPSIVPSDNPFVGQPGSDLIWAFGLRNPWRFSFDRATGRLFLGDVGQNRFEEIDLIEKGGNYGWNTMEASSCFDPMQGCDQTGLMLPIHDYDRTDGRSVTGGYVYRGALLPALRGLYVFGDFISGRIWTLEETGPDQWSRSLLFDSGLPIASFGEDEAGELYVVSIGGEVFQLSTSIPTVDLSVLQSVSSQPGFVGLPLAIQIEVMNRGNRKAENVTLFDQLPSGMDIEGIQASQGVCQDNGATFDCVLGEIIAGGSARVDVTVTPLQSGAFENHVEVSSDQLDANPVDNNSALLFDVVAQADLALTKVASTPEALAGEEVLYQLDFLNRGPQAAPSVQLLDLLPEGVEFVSVEASRGDCSQLDGEIHCNVDVLEVDEQIRVDLTVRVLEGGNLENQAEVMSGVFDPVLSNNQSQAAVQVTGLADLSLSLQYMSSVPSGEIPDMEILVSNHGPSTAFGLQLALNLMPLPSILSIQSAPGACAIFEEGVNCGLDSLSAGGQWRIGLEFSTAETGAFRASAMVDSQTEDPNLADNESILDFVVGNPVEADIVLVAELVADNEVTGLVHLRGSVTNNGPAGIPSVDLNGVLSEPVSVSSIVLSQGDCEIDGMTMHCQLGSIAPKDKVHFDLALEALGLSGLEVDLSAVADAIDPNPADNSVQLSFDSFRPYRLEFPQFAFGGGLGSQIIILSLVGEVLTEGEIVAKDSVGSAMEFVLDGEPAAGERPFSIPARGSIRLTTDSTGPIQSGSLALTASRPIGAVILFGGPQGLAGVGSSRVLTKGFVAPLVLSDEFEQLVNTGIAIVNLENRPLEVEFRLLNEAGQELAITTLTLEAMGHLARFVRGFPWTPDIDFGQFQGTIRAHLNGKAAVVTLQLRDGEMATLPVAPLH